MRLAQERLEVNPGDGLATSHLGYGYAFLGDPQLAKDAIERALKLRPQDPATLVRAAEAYLLIGDSLVARTYVEKAMELGYSEDLIRRSPTLAALAGDSQD